MSPLVLLHGGPAHGPAPARPAAVPSSAARRGAAAVDPVAHRAAAAACVPATPGASARASAVRRGGVGHVLPLAASAGLLVAMAGAMLGGVHAPAVLGAAGLGRWSWVALAAGVAAVALVCGASRAVRVGAAVDVVGMALLTVLTTPIASGAAAAAGVAATGHHGGVAPGAAGAVVGLAAAGWLLAAVVASRAPRVDRWTALHLGCSAAMVLTCTAMALHP